MANPNTHRKSDLGWGGYLNLREKREVGAMFLRKVEAEGNAELSQD
jgi:hypothetical protein